MDQHTYCEQGRKLRIYGLDDFTFDELDALEAAAETRKDIATLVVIDTMRERENGFVRHLDALADPAKLDEMLDKLSSLGPFDQLWHILFGLVERKPSLLPRIESAIAHWPDEHRLIPHSWWNRMLAGERQDYFRLARNSGIKWETLDPRTFFGTRRACIG